MKLNELEVKETIDEYNELIAELERIGVRWVNTGKGHHEVGSGAIKKIDFVAGKFTFFGNLSTSGMGQEYEVPLKFLFDEDGLIEEAKLHFQERDRQWREQVAIQRRLEAEIDEKHKEIKAINPMYNPPSAMYGFPYWGLSQTTGKISLVV